MYSPHQTLGFVSCSFMQYGELRDACNRRGGRCDGVTFNRRLHGLTVRHPFEARSCILPVTIVSLCPPTCCMEKVASQRSHSSTRLYTCLPLGLVGITVTPAQNSGKNVLPAMRAMNPISRAIEMTRPLAA